jgi:hypothetical protein
MKTLADVIFEAQASAASIQEMRNAMGAKKTKIPPKLEKIKDYLFNTTEFEMYEFLDSCEFWEVTNKEAPGWYQTAGVRAANDRVEFYYDKDFINKISKEELLFLVAHEASHILRHHEDRTSKAGHEGNKANIAQDMIINHDILGTGKIGDIQVKMPEGGMQIPEEFHKDYKDDKMAYYYENMYNWLNQNPEHTESQEGEGGEQQEKDYWEEGSIVKVNSGEHEGEYRKITKVNGDGTFETEPVDIEKEYEKVRKGQ